MKKKLTFFATLFMLVCVIAAIFFGVRFTKTYIEYKRDTRRLEEIESFPQSKVVKGDSWQKNTQKFERKISTKDIYKDQPTFKYNNTRFISYSKEWDEKKLEALCEELLKNTHGREIDYLEQVIVRGEKDEEAIGTQQEKDKTLQIPIHIQGTLPGDLVLETTNEVSCIVLYDGDNRTTVESMARTLSHEYGHHFTFFYFNLEEDEMKDSEYYKLRMTDKMKIDRSDRQEYLDNHMWYLIEIAANDYQYLMGSPNTRNIERFYDEREALKMSMRNQKNKDELINPYKDCFNLEPHENIAIPLPDRVEGLSELFFGALQMDAPQYVNRDKEAEEIEIKFSRRKEYDHRYYSIKWDKPWTDKNITYTLVAYDKNDELLGGVKSIAGDQKAQAYIGQVVIVNSDETMYHWWSGYWTDFDFVRFRVVVSFPDGTSAVSKPIDKKF